MIQLYQSGKTRKKTRKTHIEEYELTTSSLDQWFQQSENTGSFKEKDNRSPEEKELIELRIGLKQLKMENNILKQAALILGRK